MESDDKPTKTGDEVVEYREEEGFGLERNAEDSVYREQRRDGEDGNVQPVELVKHVVPSERGQSLLALKRPGDIIVGYVDVNRGGRVLALGESGRRGGPVRHLRRRDRGHGGRGETGREGGGIAVGLFNDCVCSLGRANAGDRCCPNARSRVVTT